MTTNSEPSRPIVHREPARKHSGHGTKEPSRIRVVDADTKRVRWVLPLHRILTYRGLARRREKKTMLVGGLGAGGTRGCPQGKTLRNN